MLCTQAAADNPCLFLLLLAPLRTSTLLRSRARTAACAARRGPAGAAVQPRQARVASHCEGIAVPQPIKRFLGTTHKNRAALISQDGFTLARLARRRSCNAREKQTPGVARTSGAPHQSFPPLSVLGHFRPVTGHTQSKSGDGLDSAGNGPLSEALGRTSEAHTPAASVALFVSLPSGSAVRMCFQKPCKWVFVGKSRAVTPPPGSPTTKRDIPPSLWAKGTNGGLDGAPAPFEEIRKGLARPAGPPMRQKEHPPLELRRATFVSSAQRGGARAPSKRRQHKLGQERCPPRKAEPGNLEDRPI